MSTIQRMIASSWRMKRTCGVLNGGDQKKLLIFTVICLAVIDNALALKCYKCAVTPEKNDVKNVTVYTHICSKFDESDDYIVDCEYSTMCLKKVSTLHLQNGQKQETITRGCAPQKDTTQVFRDRQWHQEHSVQEVYEEGCSDFTQNNLAGTVVTYCYCRGKLCNSASRNNDSVKAITVIFLFNVLCWITHRVVR